MRSSRKGFTLVEILIVVVILGILAAIVVPQFTSASTEAVKGALKSQIQTISSQLELYRVRHQGAYPVLGGGAEHNGWGDMVSADFLKEEPFNGYTRNTAVSSGDLTDAMGATRDTEMGWYFDDTDDSESYGQIFAAGYNPASDRLAHEEGFQDDELEEPAP